MRPVAGNFIGTDVTGDRPLGAYGDGVLIGDGASANWVGVNPNGGSARGDEGNVISGTGVGVEISDANSNVVAGNKIGTDISGTAPLGNGVGVEIDEDAASNIIGGTTAAAGNLITDNSGPGVTVGTFAGDTSSVGNQVTANRIFGNGGPAIDLGDDGVTYNSSVPRQGPNNLQNFPIIFTSTYGSLQGLLGGSAPDTTFRIDFFASSAYGPGGSGEAEDYLGSWQVTTDATGQAAFAVPFMAPAGLPIITATATDPQGNTSEVSALRRVTLVTPSPSLRAVPNKPLVLSASSGGGFAIEDSDAGPTNPLWDLTFSVSEGTLTLSSVAGLTGSGDGTGSLSYSGLLSAVDSALNGLTYTPPAGPHVSATLNLGAQSYGAPALQTQFVITDGVFVVDTTADNGLGSLRQAIVDSNSATGELNTIAFAVPGSGVQTIVADSPLPAITNPLVIDGTTQPGYASAPLIAIVSQGTGDADPLTVSSDVTVKGLAIGGASFPSISSSTMLTIESVPLPQLQGGFVNYQIVLPPESAYGYDLMATAQAEGAATSLSLLDEQGHVVIQSDGLSPSQPIDVINIYIPSGTYSLHVSDIGGNGPFALTTMLTPYLGFSPVPPEPQNVVGGDLSSIVAGDFNGDGKPDLAIADLDGVQILLGNGDGTFQPAKTVADLAEASLVAGDFNGDGRLDLAVSDLAGVQMLLGNGDGTFQPAEPVAAGIGGELTAGYFTGDGHLDLAVADGDGVAILLGNGDGTFQSPVIYAAGSPSSARVAGDFNGDGPLDLAVSVSDGVEILLGNGDGTFQPARTVAAGIGGDLAAGYFSGDGHLDLAVADGDGVAILLGNGDGTFQAPVTYGVGFGSPSSSLVAGDFNGDGRTDLAVISDSLNTTAVSALLGNGDGTFEPPIIYEAGVFPMGIAAGDFNGGGQTDLAVGGSNEGRLFSNNSADEAVSVLLGNSDGTFSVPGPSVTSPHATPLVADVNGNGTDDVLVVDGSGNILFRQAIPGQPGTFEPPVTVNRGHPSRDITWIPYTIDGPLLASVDAEDDSVSLYAYRDAGFVLIGSLATGQLPAQIIAADLNGDGVDDLVVRNAGDGTFSVFAANNPVDPVVTQSDIPIFLPPVTLPVGPGVSDVQAVDTTGSGRLDLVVTNSLSGQVSILYNQGDGTFAPSVPYRAGTELSAVDPGSTPEVTSLEATAGVAAGPLTPGGANSLVTINPGSNSLDVLAGLGGGHFANPVTIPTPSPAQIVRMGDFTGNGLDDLAVLTADGVSIYLANGQGGFLLPQTTYAVPSESDGLTVADLTGDGKLDLLVGDPYGDVLVLAGNGDGTFQPFREANQAIELAAVNLNGSNDIIYADQGLDRVVVDYGGKSIVRANRSTGLLDPGAVALADLNGNGIPDLIVANSGSNNVLIYPGLRNGQFGPAVNDGNGYFVGTNPVGITVAYLTGALPDLVVADEGSDQVSILLNQGNFNFAPGPRLNSGGSGPVSTVVGNFNGGAYPDLLVTNSQSNDVMLLPGVGQGFFDDQHPQPYSVGSDPGQIFVGDFNGQTDLVTVNAGSNDLTLISNFDSQSPVTTTIASGGLDPETAFAFSTSSGFDDLVVGNTGDGVLALFGGSASGLTLMSSETEANLPNRTGLAFSSLTGGQVQFYAATEGQEAATLVALSLGVGAFSPISAPASPASSGVAQLVPLQESSLALVGTLLTVTIDASAGETEALSASAVSLGQSVLGKGGLVWLGIDDDELEATAPAIDPAAVPVSPGAPAWQRYTLGTDEAIERFDREHPSLSPGSSDDAPGTIPRGRQNEAGSAPAGGIDPGPSENSSAKTDLGTAAADIVIDLMCGPDRRTAGRRWWSEEAAVGTPFKLTTTDPSSIARARGSAVLRSLGAHSHASDLAVREGASCLPAERIRDGAWALPGRGPWETVDVPAFLVLTSLVAGYVHCGSAGQRTRSGNRWTGTRRWHRF